MKTLTPKQFAVAAAARLLPAALRVPTVDLLLPSIVTRRFGKSRWTVLGSAIADGVRRRFSIVVIRDGVGGFEVDEMRLDGVSLSQTHNSREK